MTAKQNAARIAAEGGRWGLAGCWGVRDGIDGRLVGLWGKGGEHGWDGREFLAQQFWQCARRQSFTFLVCGVVVQGGLLRCSSP